MERQIVTLYTGDDFIAHAEYAEGYLFLHCTVKVWNKSTLKKIKLGIQLIKEYAYKDLGYEKPLFTYTQNPRWVKMIGGHYVKDFNLDKEHFELWKWE